MTRGVEGQDRKQPRLSNSAHDHLQSRLFRAGCSGHLTISHPSLQGAQERGRIEQDAASARRSLEERLAAVETGWENERREWEREREQQSERLAVRMEAIEDVRALKLELSAVKLKLEASAEESRSRGEELEKVPFPSD